MSDDIMYTDIDGDGVDDAVVFEEQADGSVVALADIDGDGTVDVVGVDYEGDGVYDQIYNDNTGEYTDTTDTSDPTSYDGADGPLDADAGDTTTTGDTAPTGDEYTYDGPSDVPQDTAGDPSYAGDYSTNPQMLSDMLAQQHETNMTIINNMA